MRATLSLLAILPARYGVVTVDDTLERILRRLFEVVAALMELDEREQRLELLFSTRLTGTHPSRCAAGVHGCTHRQRRARFDSLAHVPAVLEPLIAHRELCRNSLPDSRPPL